MTLSSSSSSSLYYFIMVMFMVMVMIMFMVKVLKVRAAHQRCGLERHRRPLPDPRTGASAPRFRTREALRFEPVKSVSNP